MDTPDLVSVLLVEDNPADVYLMQRAVGDCDSSLHLFIVPDGAEALAFLRKDPPFTHVPTPRLILLDLNLPKMYGMQILQEIRQLSAYRATPIVIVSSADKVVEEPRCLQLGATAYPQKSSNFYAYFDSLKAIVSYWLNQPAFQRDDVVPVPEQQRET